MPESDEKALLRSGDPRAFDRLYAEFAPRVLGYLLRLTGSRAEAEDLVQETFLAAYAHRERETSPSRRGTPIRSPGRLRWNGPSLASPPRSERRYS